LSDDVLDPDERLLSLIAHLYFIKNKAQKQIADEPTVRALYNRTQPTGRRRGGGDQTLSQATVNRLLQRALQRGVVSISIDASFAVDSIKEEELSKRMRDAFGLQECSVLRAKSRAVDPSTSEPNTNEGATSQELADQREPDEDRLILSLVNYTASKLEHTLRSGDHLLCAGGRTVCWLARAARRIPLSKRDLIFTPLSGRLWVEDFRTGDADIMERPLDADDAVHTFAEALENEPGGRFSQINQPLYCSADDPKEAAAAAKSILSNHCAIGPDGTWNWGLPDAARAYVGVGSLASGTHRLAVFLRKFEADDKSAKESYLRAAGPSLIQISQLCSQANLPLPGDMGNRLFPCLMMASELEHLTDPARLAADLRQFAPALQKISREVEELNARAVVMTWRHLRRTRGVHVIGGGRGKLQPLWTLLLAAYFDSSQTRKNGDAQDAAPMVKELTTDTVTAERLLVELEFIKRDENLCAWYGEQLLDLGLTASAPDL
jgi:DNA-binding transcriptional regulator LsrR (DeoR family)